MFGSVETSMLTLSIGLRWKCPPLPEVSDPKIKNLSLYHNLEQVVDKPTREDKILDLLFTNNKSSLQKIEILPGIGKSDHEIVFAEIDTLPCRIPKPKRNIFLYRKADWDGIRSNLNSLYTSIKNDNQGYSANDLCTKFKSTLTSSKNDMNRALGHLCAHIG